MNDVTVVTRATLRERKKAKTRQAIEACALELFARKGYESTTVEAIATACDVSPRTFFRYFASKDDLLQGDNEARLAELVALVHARPAGEPPFRALRHAIEEMASHHEHDRESIRLRYRVFERNPSLYSRGLESQHQWEQAVVDALSARDQYAAFVYAPVELRLIATAGLAALRAAIDVWRTDEGTGSLATVVRMAFDRLADGLDTHEDDYIRRGTAAAGVSGPAEDISSSSRKAPR